MAVGGLFDQMDDIRGEGPYVFQVFLVAVMKKGIKTPQTQPNQRAQQNPRSSISWPFDFEMFIIEFRKPQTDP